MLQKYQTFKLQSDVGETHSLKLKETYLCSWGFIQTDGTQSRIHVNTEYILSLPKLGIAYMQMLAITRPHRCNLEMAWNK